jgi:copper chaperone CopZ
MAVQKFFVEGLSRDDEVRVESALKSMPGVIYAAASHSDACAEVEFEDDTVTTAQLKEALGVLGFTSRIAG